MGFPPAPTLPQFRRLSGRVLTGSPRLAVYGDSLMNYGSKTVGTGATYTTRSAAAYACGYLNGALRFDHSGNFGIPGEGSVEILARLPQVLAYKPAVVLFNGGTNDVNRGISDANIIAAVQAIYTGLAAAGIFPVYVLQTTRSAASWTGGVVTSTDAPAARRKQMRINQAIRTWAIEQGYAFIDPDPFMADPFTGLPMFGYTYDGLHWTGRTAIRIGAALANILRPLFPITDALFGNAADVWAADNTTGNFLSGGLMAGTSGSLLGAYATGTVASGWRSLIPNITTPVGTVAYSKEARPGGLGDWQVVTINGVNGGGSSDFVGIATNNIVPSASGPIKPGDVLELVAEFGPNTSNGQFRSLVANAIVNDGVTGALYQFGETINDDQMPVSVGSLVSNPLRFTVPSIAGASPYILLQIGGLFYLNFTPVNEVLRIGRVSLRKVG